MMDPDSLEFKYRFRQAASEFWHRRYWRAYVDSCSTVTSVI